jgi:hypothetical protein
MITNLKGAKALERMAEAKERLAASEKQIYASFLDSLKRGKKSSDADRKPTVPTSKASNRQAETRKK